MENALRRSPNHKHISQHISIDCKAAKILTPGTAEGIKLADRSVDRLLAEVRRHRRAGVFAAVASVSMVTGAAMLIWFNGGREALLADRRRDGGSSRPGRA
ncbi:hypothetical protein SLS53_008733 [Cytospora paraplurivora]|uniref:Uncharacterized protein n=1 Tax=Cytospora paraplurivora TaxID=2898453 RepID=A0AAN9YCJ7_9PEZI